MLEMISKIKLMNLLSLVQAAAFSKGGLLNPVTEHRSQ
jgi:hypothetical protein